MKYESYRQMDKVLDELYAEKKYEEAIELLGIAREQFPNDLFEILWYEAVIYVISGDHENSLTTLEEMIDKGFFAELEWGIFDPVRDDARFTSIFEANQCLKAEAQKNARMEYQVYTPEGYTSEGKYPLFIALHGDGHSLAYFKSNWEATGLLDKGFVLVYVQSSQVLSTDGSGWTPEYEIARRDIKAAYDEIVGQYSIDRDNVLIGGFSGGSIAAIEVTMANTLPVKGFVSLCPSLKPPSFSKENVKRAVQRGVRGVLMEGELEGEVPAEQEMIVVLKEANFPYQFHINPNTGHAFPKDFGQKLLDAIEFIMD
jgi:predicted esterase